MKLTVRSYRDDRDYWRIRAFLRRVFLLNDRREWSWQAYRWDYWRWHGVENLGHGDLEKQVFLWETDDGQIGAVLNPEGPGHAFLQIDPRWRTPNLEEHMIDIAQDHLARDTEGAERKLWLWVHEHDRQRQEILARRGYTKGEWLEYQRRRLVSAPVPDVPVATGYVVRALGTVDELPARSWASWRAFHPDAPDEAYEGWDWYLNIQRAPLYRRDLDLVAVASDGEIASFCTVWFDDVTRTGAFEPVATTPAHQRRGLGKAVMCEGLRRLGHLGATLVLVGSYEVPAHALYASVGFTDYELAAPWGKEL
ncbi:MAG: GNAT family N-acetyltransferase [Anaerolineae bacterium]|jgi:ribosomal protein S18 acetylase RimI-like enzyme